LVAGGWFVEAGSGFGGGDLVAATLVEPRLAAISLLAGPGCSSLSRNVWMVSDDGGSTLNPRSSRLQPLSARPPSRAIPIAKSSRFGINPPGDLLSLASFPPLAHRNRPKSGRSQT